VEELTEGLPASEVSTIVGVLTRADTSFLNGDQRLISDAYRSIVKTLRFLGFFQDDLKLKTKDAKGKARTCLDAFGDVMAERMAHESHDRDLVVMRHNFVLEDEAKNRWGHTSTWIDSGESHKSGGVSLMSKSVGVTAAIGARMVLEDKIPQRGVLSPMHKEIYEPILAELERNGIVMVEESERPGGAPTSSTRPKL